AVHVVDLGAFHVLTALRVDQDAHTPELSDAVIVAWLVVQGHAIGRARTAHTAHVDAQGVIGLARLFEQLSDFGSGVRCDVNHLNFPSRGADVFDTIPYITGIIPSKLVRFRFEPESDEGLYSRPLRLESDD